MRKLIAILGGLTLVGSASTVTIACSNEKDIFELRDGTNTVIDTFKKSDVVDYYFKFWGDGIVDLVINFKNTGLKEYNDLYGGIRDFYPKLETALGFPPNQDKYNARPL